MRGRVHYLYNGAKKTMCRMVLLGQEHVHLVWLESVHCREMLSGSIGRMREHVLEKVSFLRRGVGLEPECDRELPVSSCTMCPF